MIVYRYLREEHALVALQTNLLKVGRLLELNDPADCQPAINSSDAGSIAGPSGSSPIDVYPELYHDVGMLSFSSEITDPVIWSHYADGHKGLALGYNFSSNSGSLHRVDYADARPIINHQEAQSLRKEGRITEEFALKVITTGFKGKALSWKYESEYRMFFWLHRCEMAGSLYFTNLPPQAKLVRVVMGLRCRLTRTDIGRAAKMGKTVNLEILQTRMDPSSYRLIVS